MTEAIIQKTCPKCAREEMFWTTVQLRSADEGSTVFYRCVCGYKYEPQFSMPLIYLEQMLTLMTERPRTIRGKLVYTKMWKRVYFGERMYK
jgi:hypothetical protein